MSDTTLRDILHHEGTDADRLLVDIIDAIEGTELEEKVVEILVRRGYGRD